MKTKLEQLRSKHPLIYNIAAILLIIFLLAVAAHFIMQIGTRHGARRTVPDFSGIHLADAEALARKHDLRLQINDSLFVPAYEGGIVLDQLPEGGVEVKPGRTVYITINSFREKMVPVPYVANRSLRQAKNMLEIAGLSIAELIYRPDIATNYVLEERYGKQLINEQSHVEAEMGSGITLYVGVDAEHNRTVIPQIVGLSLADAKSRLWELGLNVGQVKFDEGINLLNQKEARVYLQQPGAEQAVILGTPVSLQLTLDVEVVKKRREEAERTAREILEQRIKEEQEQQWLDSLAREQLSPDEHAAAQTEPDDESLNLFFN